VTRLEQLQQFVDDDPDDPFNLYALALELTKSDAAKAETLFKKLLSEHKDYLPTYYQAANLFESNGEHDLAIMTLQNGIALARSTNERKALSELQTMLDEFGD
jgi:tetratricopeptide (TPR) repeat protein